MSVNIVSREVAEAEFSRFVEAMDIDDNPANLSDEDVKGFDHQKSVIIGAIERGLLSVDDKGQPVMMPETVSVDGDSITFYEPDGAALMASDGKKKNDRMRQTYAILGAMTKQPPKVYANMKHRELKVCQAVMVLFLG